MNNAESIFIRASLLTIFYIISFSFGTEILCLVDDSGRAKSRFPVVVVFTPRPSGIDLSLLKKLFLMVRLNYHSK